jgi:hypothetical protein
MDVILLNGTETISLSWMQFAELSDQWAPALPSRIASHRCTVSPKKEQKHWVAILQTEKLVGSGTRRDEAVITRSLLCVLRFLHCMA